jgi:hypothetical protein
MVVTLRLNVLYGLLPCTALTDGFCTTEVESVYCVVRTESLYKADKFRLQKVKHTVTTRYVERMERNLLTYCDILSDNCLSRKTLRHGVSYG